MAEQEIIAPAADADVSLADHEASYAPANSFDEQVANAAPVPAVEAIDEDEEPESVVPPNGPAPTRHRAASQQAKPDDVAAIGELTKRVRAAEAELGITRKPGESQRVFNLRKQVEIAERLKAVSKPASVLAPPLAAAPVVANAPSAFADPEPTQAQFMDKADPYGAFVSAHTRWEWKKEQFDAEQANAKTQQAQELKARQEKFAGWVKGVEDTHTARMTTFISNNQAVKAEMEAAADLSISPIMYGAVTLSERGPEIMLEYARHPELVEDLFLQTEGKPLIQRDGTVNPLVAIVQRRLISRLSAASTGSAPARVAVPVTRPPNPVRTAPQTPSATPPGDGASLADHERFYGPKHRRS
jgi:hypothetical protein